MSQPPIDPRLSLSALILAGGQSLRMGRDKALIEVQGIPLLKRTCLVALRCTSKVYVVTFRPETYRPLLPPESQLIQECPLPNQPIPHGPLVGFAQGLTQMQTDWVLLLACDLPYLQAEILQHWTLQLLDTEAAIVLPRSQQGWEPLCGFYQTRCLTRLTALIAQGARSFQSWLAQEAVQAIAFSHDPDVYTAERRMLFNCNTPEELEKVKSEK